MWLLIGMLDIPFTYRNDEVKDYQKAEARRLVAGGINAGNQSQALELLLKIASDYEVGTTVSPLGARYWGYFGLGALVLVAGLIWPTLSIGFWKGRQRVRWWRFWVKLLTFTIPSVVLTSIILPWILHWSNLVPPP